MEPGFWGLLGPVYYGYNGESLDTIRKREIHLDTLQLVVISDYRKRKKERQKEMTKTSVRPTEYVPPWRRLLQ